MKKTGAVLMAAVLAGSVLLGGCGKDRKREEEAAKRLETVKAVSERMFTYPDSEMDELWETMRNAANVMGEGVEGGESSEEDVEKTEKMLDEMFGAYFTDEGYLSLVSTGHILEPLSSVIVNHGEISLKSIEEVEDSSDEDDLYQYEAVIDLNGEEIRQKIRFQFDEDKIKELQYVDSTLSDKISG